MAKSYDLCFNLLLIGDSGVGKTEILDRLVHNTFNSTGCATGGESICYNNFWQLTGVHCSLIDCSANV